MRLPTRTGDHIHGGTDIHGDAANSNNGVRAKSDSSFGGVVDGPSFIDTCETGVKRLIRRGL